MTHSPKQIVVTDPRTFDGTQYEVAERAVAQIAGLVQVTLEAMNPAQRMVLNAELGRQMERGQEPDTTESVLNRKMIAIRKSLELVKRELDMVQRAAGYDPKHPPR